MTTITQLAKAAKDKLIPSIVNMGFKHCGKLAFAREVNGVHQVILPDLSYGANLKFVVTCFVEEYKPSSTDKYPHNIPITTGGKLGKRLLAGTFWEVESLDNIDEVFLDVVANIEAHALPWFETVRSRQAYVDNLYPHLKEKVEQDGRLEKILQTNSTNGGGD